MGVANRVSDFSSLLASPPAPHTLSGNGLGQLGQCNDSRIPPALTGDDKFPEQLPDLGGVLDI